jgi:hypothetical protein
LFDDEAIELTKGAYGDAKCGVIVGPQQYQQFSQAVAEENQSAHAAS